MFIMEIYQKINFYNLIRLEHNYSHNKLSQLYYYNLQIIKLEKKIAKTRLHPNLSKHY